MILSILDFRTVITENERQLTQDHELVSDSVKQLSFINRMFIFMFHTKSVMQATSECVCNILRKDMDIDKYSDLVLRLSSLPQFDTEDDADIILFIDLVYQIYTCYLFYAHVAIHTSGNAIITVCLYIYNL